MDEKILIEIIFISVGLLCIVTGGVTKLIYKRKYKIVIGTVEKTEVRLRSDRADYSVTALYNGNMRVTGLYAGRLEGVNIFSKEEEREKALSAKFPVGSEIEVYVNSKNPSKTIIFNQDSGVRIFALSLCILCSALITISPIVLLAI